MTVNEMKNFLNSQIIQKTFSAIYGEDMIDYQKNRYLKALDDFIGFFNVKNDADIGIYTAPGRTEIAGNHTDHQHGKVLASSVGMDIIGFAVKNDTNVVNVKSEGFSPDHVDISSLERNPKENNTSASLIRGVCAYFSDHGKKIGGFDAFTTSNVPKGSGLSSSAAFESFLGCVLAHEFNGGELDPVENAIAGQFAESKYFGKPCGLMDQLASAFGGLVYIDFNDPKNPIIEKAVMDLDKLGYKLCVVDTGGSHANLTHEYAAIPNEMKSVAAEFGKEVLRDVDYNEFVKNIPDLRKKHGDRSVLRSLHFFSENARVGQIKDIVTSKTVDFEKFLCLIQASGDSSIGYLQNIYSTSAINEQGLSLGLALAQDVLGGRGASRVHGGGFAGSILAFVPNDLFDSFKTEMDGVFGENACQKLKMRAYGAVSLKAVSDLIN